MKKVILPALVIATALFASCGPNAEELAKKAQATADSIAAAEMQLHMEDSLAAVAAMEAANATAVADSLMKVAEQAKADSIANIGKGVKNTVKKVVKKTATTVKDMRGAGKGQINTKATTGDMRGAGEEINKKATVKNMRGQ